MKKKDIYNKLHALLSHKSEIEFAYLFGSFISAENYHDIDIAVYLKYEFNYMDFEKYPYGYESLLISEISKVLGTDKIDLVVINKANLLLQKEIINKGKLLFERDMYNRIKLENYIRKQYIDAEPLRKIKLKYLGNKINNA